VITSATIQNLNPRKQDTYAGQVMRLQGERQVLELEDVKIMICEEVVRRCVGSKGVMVSILKYQLLNELLGIQLLSFLHAVFVYIETFECY
jgi:hypothetical protein